MAFGIPGSDGGNGNNGKFLGRIQYDARVGFWKIVKRAQGPDGSWGDEASDFFKDPTFLMDLGTLEVGYIKLTSPPAFVLVPYGHPVPPQPEEMVTNSEGRQVKAFLPGCRVQVASPKLFGDADAYYFSVNSKTVLSPMDDLYQAFERSPEAAQGLIPLVAVQGTTKVEIQTKKGKNTYLAPNFKIVGWKERLPVFGERTVALPMPPASAPPATQFSQRPTASAAPPTNHVPPPQPAAAAHMEPPPHVTAPVPATAEAAGMPDSW